MKEARRMGLELLSWKGTHAERSHRHRNKEGRGETAKIILDVKGDVQRRSPVTDGRADEGPGGLFRMSRDDMTSR